MTAGTLRRAAAAALLLLPSLLPPPSSRAGAQQPEQRLRTQREELERIRQERATLEGRMTELRTNVHDLSDEVTNLDSRALATQRIVAALNAQIASIAEDVDSASLEVSHTEQELGTRRATMRKRLADIYKRGPLYTVEALLSAGSFGELVARYKYLHLLALHDRSLVRHVEILRDRLAVERKQLLFLQGTIEDARRDKEMEEDRLRSLERERAASLVLAQRSARETGARIARLLRTESQLSSTIAALEVARRRLAIGRPNVARSTSTITTSDYGTLDWPVDGPLLYGFGKAQTASNATIRWNGVGIEAVTGTPVHTIAAGRVVSVGQLGTYGLTVIIEHGGGDYSIYGSLARADVRLHQTVTKGEPIGSVGISDPDYPAHLHFEIRHGGPAVDPAIWLRGDR